MLVARVRAGAARRCFRCCPGCAISAKSRCWRGVHLGKGQRYLVAEWAPRAVLCLDGFHVVAWATTALDEVCRAFVAALRRTGRIEQAANIKPTRWTLLKTLSR